MQQLHLMIDHMTFYCPMTGNIILENGEKFASPALLFHFSHKQNELSFPTLEIQQLFDETLEEVENGNYDSYIYNNTCIHTIHKAFEILIYEKLKHKNNYILYILNYDDPNRAPSGNLFYLGFDMNYYEEENENLFDYSDLFSYHWSQYGSVAKKFHKNEPTLEGCAAFVADKNGLGFFYFFSNPKEWQIIIELLMLSDNINQPFSDISSKKMLEFHNMQIDDIFEDLTFINAFKKTQKRINQLLENHSILFIGTIQELIRARTPFAKEINKSFGEKGAIFTDEFLFFLKNYIGDIEGYIKKASRTSFSSIALNNKIPKYISNN